VAAYDEDLSYGFSWLFPEWWFKLTIQKVDDEEIALEND
jgi:hypothetical protein